MSLLNKYMHPRNIYKTPPNFKELAIIYPEFRNFVKQDISGKVSIDFKDQATLCVLTNTLLKKDFDLDVVIPSDRLVPTLPLRLNYLLWIEDLLACSKTEPSEPVFGIDIGTGSTGIYSLLAAKSHGWNMFATEIDAKNVASAKCNIKKNCLEDLITVQQIPPGQMLIGVLNEESTYDFCMCNPPFFSSEHELDGKSRSKARPAPHNAPTGAIEEMVVSGGEVAFIGQIIDESKVLRNKIRVYTTMVGLKSSLAPLKASLADAGIEHVVQTEFCQGHTTRWGLAWTFHDNLHLEQSLPRPVKRKQVKKKPPLKYVVPSDCALAAYTVTAVAARVKQILVELEMECTEVNADKHETLYCATAFQNTWSNQRRKRRCAALPTTQTEHDCPSAKKRKLEDNTDNVKPIMKCNVCVRKISSQITVQMSWLDGQLGRDAVHQVLQYMKNKLSGNMTKDAGSQEMKE